MKSFFKNPVLVIIPLCVIFCVFMVMFNAYDTTRNKGSVHTSSEISQMTVYLVNINTADISELCGLDHIGRSTAQKIIEYRTEHGKFETISDIMNISGISEHTYTAIAPFITV